MADSLVAGEQVGRPLYELVRAAEAHLVEEQEKPDPDNSLIAVLCDTVRLVREHRYVMGFAHVVDSIELRTLRAELTAARSERDLAQDTCVDLEKELATERERVGELRAALEKVRKHIGHARGCVAWMGGRCTCNVVEKIALAAALAAPPTGPGEGT